jgi:hypothetical protein
VATYQVTGDIATLWEIAISLYGSSRYAQKIADWNGLHAPFQLRVGQVLKLDEKPKLKMASGSEQLLKRWRDYFALATPETKTVMETASLPETCAGLMPRGESLLQQHKYKEALESFHNCRTQDGASVSAWLFELKTLRLLGRDRQMRRLRERALSSFPQLNKLPEFQTGKPSSTSE